MVYNIIIYYTCRVQFISTLAHYILTHTHTHTHIHRSGTSILWIKVSQSEKKVTNFQIYIASYIKL